jgi:VanZ family protein
VRGREGSSNPRSPLHSFLKYWLPVLLVMGIIFGLSTNLGRTSNTSRIIGPILHFLFPSISEEATQRVVFLVRKGGHLTEYALLAGLIWRALRKPRQRDPRPWSWKLAAYAITGAALYACSDEYHQSFHAARMAQWSDVLLDTAGATIGICLIWLTGQLRRAR